MKSKVCTKCKELKPLSAFYKNKTTKDGLAPDCKEDSIELDEREVKVLKDAVNRLVELTADGKANLGGEIHEEAIVRVIKIKEVE